MTRINGTVPAKKLCDSHLIAEYREILRVFKLAKRTDKAPTEFTLGTGHVVFFYDKLEYAHKRFECLRQEILDRGFTPKMEFDDKVLASKMQLYNDWPGTEEADILIKQRLMDRAYSMKSIRYRGNLITADEYRNILYH